MGPETKVSFRDLFRHNSSTASVDASAWMTYYVRTSYAFIMGTDKFECPGCDKSFSNKVLLGRHYERTHALLEVAPNTPQSAKDRTIPPISSPPRAPQSSEPLEQLTSTLQQDVLPVQGPGPHLISASRQAVSDSTHLGHEDISCETLNFFASLGDKSEKLYPRVAGLKPKLNDLSKPVRAVIDYCSQNGLTCAETKNLYNLITSLEGFNPEGHLPLQSQFGTAESFAEYLTKARKNAVIEEGWVNAVINSTLGENRTGVFRPVIDLLIRTVDEAGGSSAVIEFEETRRGEERVMSAPWNANAMQQYQNCLNTQSGRVVMIDVFSDGAILSNSGTQSANNMRVRFSNIRGLTNKWHEVGIVPTPDTGGAKVSADAIKREKNELWHRLFFLAFKELLQMSHVGIPLDGIFLFPRLGMNVADQVQERPTCGLKGHDSFCDCTHCLMPTRLRIRKTETASCVKRRRVPTTHTEGSENSYQSERDSQASQQNDSPELGPELVAKDVSDMRKKLRDIQTDLPTFPKRDVYTTVRNQHVVAKHKMFPQRLQSSVAEVRKARHYLEQVSALEFPPAQACFAGAGSYPFRLYSSVGFDKLHVIEHGILRQVTDDAYKIFDSSPQYNGLSKGEVVSIANQRILDIPPSAQLRKFPAFRKRADEKHAGISGKIRRELTPFLWTCLMGVARNVEPDDDEFVQTLLKIDLPQRQLLGINEAPQAAPKSSKEIKELSDLGFDVGKQVSLMLDCAVNTKCHRIMRHIADHFNDFGCIRKGSTDDNETMHKTTKKAYRSTNKHFHGIAPQLLRARVELARNDEEGEIGNVRDHCMQRSQLLITRNPTVRDNRSDREAQNISERAEHAEEIADDPILEGLCNMMSLVVDDGMSPKEAEKAVLDALHPSTSSAIWRQMKSARCPATIPWCTAETIWQIVYAGDEVFNKKNRRDAIEYRHDGSVCVGILQALFKHSGNAKSRIGLIRRLKEVQAEAGNENVTKIYKNRRFAYVTCEKNEGGEKDVKLDCVPMNRFIRSVVLIPDPWVISKVFGRKQRMSTIPDSAGIRKKMYFFEVAGFKVTSRIEQTL